MTTNYSNTAPSWTDWRDPTTHLPAPTDLTALERARNFAKEVLEKNQALTRSYLVTTVCGVALVGIACIDVSNFQLGADQFLPDVAGVASKADLREAMVAALTAGTFLSGFLLRLVAQRLTWLNRVLDMLGGVGTVALVVGVSTFLPASLASAAGGDGDATNAALASAGSSLGLGIGSLYGISVLGARLMLDKGIDAFDRIAGVKAVRSKAEKVLRSIATVETGLAGMHEADRIIDALGEDGAMDQRAAQDMSNAIGGVTSELHQTMLDRELVENMGGKPSIADYTHEELAAEEFKPSDWLPVERLQQLGMYLAKFTPRYVRHLLQQAEA